MMSRPLPEHTVATLFYAWRTHFGVECHREHSDSTETELSLAKQFVAQHEYLDLFPEDVAGSYYEYNQHN
jgi:hypothetical protein